MSERTACPFYKRGQYKGRSSEQRRDAKFIIFESTYKSYNVQADVCTDRRTYIAVQARFSENISLARRY